MRTVAPPEEEAREENAAAGGGAAAAAAERHLSRRQPRGFGWGLSSGYVL